MAAVIPRLTLRVSGVFVTGVFVHRRLPSSAQPDQRLHRWSIAKRSGNTEQVVTPAEAGVQALDLTGFRPSPE
jgi:hypothetical protein